MICHRCNPASELEREFQNIYQTRMKGLPICNNTLQVRALAFQTYRGHWIGSLVTPWSILVVLVCGNETNWPTTREGTIVPIPLPAGSFSFLTMKSERFGSFFACSLMSPIDSLFNQRSAEAFAQKALNIMLTPSAQTSENEHQSVSGIPDKLSRRDFFAPSKTEVS